jgi:hypothetical protein
LLFALFGRRPARGAYRLAKATVRDGILVAWLPAPSPKHSFSTFSQNLRNLALCWNAVSKAPCSMDFIPLGHHSAVTLCARVLPLRSSSTTSNVTRWPCLSM